MREAKEIEDEDHEQILERVCAIDVAKASGTVCTRVPHPSRRGARRTRVWDVDATTNAVLEECELGADDLILVPETQRVDVADDVALAML